VKIHTEKSLYHINKFVRIVKKVTFEKYDKIKLMFKVNLMIICSNLKLTANDCIKQYLCTHHSIDHVIVNTFSYINCFFIIEENFDLNINDNKTYAKLKNVYLINSLTFHK